MTGGSGHEGCGSTGRRALRTRRVLCAVRDVCVRHAVHARSGAQCTAEPRARRTHPFGKQRGGRRSAPRVRMGLERSRGGISAARSRSRLKRTTVSLNTVHGQHKERSWGARAVRGTSTSGSRARARARVGNAPVSRRVSSRCAASREECTSTKAPPLTGAHPSTLQMDASYKKRLKSRKGGFCDSDVAKQTCNTYFRAL